MIFSRISLYINSIKYKKILLYLGTIISIIVPLVLFVNNLFAKWWLIDDHGLFSYFESEGKNYELNDFIHFLFNKTEFGKFGQSARFRPSYFFLQLTELYIFGLSPLYFYSVRLLIAVLFSVALFFNLNKFLNVFISFLLVLVIWTLPFWSDVFSRLGPAEIYGTLGFTFILISYILNPRMAFLNSILRMFGILILIGSKENFILFIFVSIVELWKLYNTRDSELILYSNFFPFKNFRYRIQTTKLILFSIEFVPILFSFYIILSLFLYFSTNSNDIYGNNTSIPERLHLYIRYIQEIHFLIITILSLILFFYSSVFRKFFKKNIYLILIIFFCLFSYVFNFIFYNAKWPTSMRYDFPGVILFPIGVILFFALFLRVLRISKQIQLFILLTLVLLNLNFTGLQINFKSSIENRNRTVAFTTFIKEITGILKLNPNADVVIRIGSPWDFEPHRSLLTFLKYYNINNRILIKVDSIPPSNNFEKQLLAELYKFENQDLQVVSKCFVFTFITMQEKKYCSDQKSHTIPW